MICVSPQAKRGAVVPVSTARSAARAAAHLLAPASRVAARDFPPSIDGIRGPGLYAWFVDDAGAADLSHGLGVHLAPGLIYAGQTGAGRATGPSSATLLSRIGRNHLGGNTYGSTFRCTLASILGRQLRLKPTGGRRMESASEQKLSRWMLEHLSVAVLPHADPVVLSTFETDVLVELKPPLNLAKLSDPIVGPRLRELRARFVRGET